MRLWWSAAVCVATVTAACGEAAATPLLLRAAPAAYLLTVDQMVSPDFTVDTAPHRLGVGDVAGSDASESSRLGASGFTGAAGEEFFRATGSLVETNGPVQVRDTVEEFSSATGAAALFAGDSTRLDAAAGATAVSTGALGDAAHATMRTAVAADGTAVVELTVEWRVDNLVDVLLLRGRQGGTRLDDALILAHRQTIIELGLATPRANATATSPPA